MTKSKRARNGVTRASGNCLYVIASSSNVATTNLSPDSSTGFGQFGAKLAQISDAFALFRFTALEFEVSGNGGITPADTFWEFGYTPEVTTSAPATASNHIDLPFSFLKSLRCTDTTRYRVPQKLLFSTGIPWFRTRLNGSYDDNFETQGLVSQRTPGSTDTVTMVVHYTIEFKDFIGPAQTPMRSMVSCLKPSSQSTDDDVQMHDQKVVTGYPAPRSMPSEALKGARFVLVEEPG